MHIRPLNHPLKENEVGGKAASLSRLIAYGVVVPKGFVIAKNALVDFEKSNILSAEFERELLKAMSQLKSVRLIVRSSAIGEDSKSFSFAGQLDSFVVEKDVELVLQTIKKCWAGLQNNRVAAYQKVSGKVLTEMGVVIQEFVEADFAGVTFTKSPIAQDEIYTEYVTGAGEQLVSGKVTPKNFSVKIGKDFKESMPFNASILIEQSLKLKEFYDCHLDIEWVAKGDEIYFVQARPITVALKSKVHWTNTNLNENYPNPISPLLYSIARDSYYHYFKNLSVLLQIHPKTIRELEYDFRNTVGIWGNRIYYNMTSIHNILSSSLLKTYFKDAFNQFVGYSKKDVATLAETKRTSIINLIGRIIGLNLRLEKHVREIEQKVTSFSKKVNETKDHEGLGHLFYEFLDLRFNQWYHASLADLFSMVHYKLLARFTERFYGEKSVGVHNTLIQAIPGLISSEPLQATWDIALLIDKKVGAKEFFLTNSSEEIWQIISTEEEWVELRMAIENYLSKWGYRCSGELMFFTENYIEQPQKFIELLQSYLRNSAYDPRKVITEKQESRRRAYKEFVVKIFKKRHVLLPISLVEVLLLSLISRLCKQAIASRERVRYKQAEMYYKFKVVVKALSADAVAKGELNQVDDIFYLTYKEIGELISSSAMFNAIELIAIRKKEFKEESEKEFPQHFSTTYGERPAMVKQPVSFVEGAKEFEGLAASGGRIKARVKILESVLDGHKLNKGDILVTKQTDPGWAMVFPIIGGLIVERGGALSHGAIVAREFGIPAVIGIEGITKQLNDNDEVILDGDLGKIQVLS